MPKGCWRDPPRSKIKGRKRLNGSPWQSLKRSPFKRSKRQAALKVRRPLRRKPTEWDAVRAKLKPLFEARGIVSCEFAFPHDCWKSQGLSFAHSRKRRDPLFELYECAVACPVAHQMLDEGMSHNEMFYEVMKAISRRGLIVPESKAA